MQTSGALCELRAMSISLNSNLLMPRIILSITEVIGKIHPHVSLFHIKFVQRKKSDRKECLEVKVFVSIFLFLATIL